MAEPVWTLILNWITYTQLVPRSKHTAPPLKTNQIVLYLETLGTKLLALVLASLNLRVPLQDC